MCKLIALFVRGLLCFVFHVFACVLSLRLFYKVDRQKDKSWESSVTMLKSFISHFSAVNSYVRHFVEHFFHFEYWLNVCSYMIHVCRGPSVCVEQSTLCRQEDKGWRVPLQFLKSFLSHFSAVKSNVWHLIFLQMWILTKCLFAHVKQVFNEWSEKIQNVQH